MADAERCAVARADDIPPGSMLRVDVGSTPVCVVRTDDGDLYAIDDTCTHEEYSLSEGELWGLEVECPAHGSRFDVRTGAVLNLPATVPVRTRCVHVEQGWVIVDS